MDLLTPQAVCHMLSISKETLLQLEKDGKLTSIRIGKTGKTGGQRRYKKEDIEAYIHFLEKRKEDVNLIKEAVISTFGKKVLEENKLI